MFQNPCKTLGFKKNMVYKIPLGWGGKPYPASGLYACILNIYKKKRSALEIKGNGDCLTDACSKYRINSSQAIKAVLLIFIALFFFQFAITRCSLTIFN